MHRLQEFVRLHRLGTGAREVARLLQMSPNTERSYRLALEAAGLLQGPASPLPPLDALKAAVQAKRPPPAQAAHETSSIEAWREQVKALWKQGMTARPIYDRLRQEEGAFQGSYWAVKRLCRRLARQRGVRAADVAIPVETGPGEVAQVDFGYTGRLLCPDTHVLRHAWVFVMVLGYSRHLFAEVVFDQKATTWLQLHRRAFEAFGGVVQTLVPDNLFAARQNRPGSACQNGSRLRIRISKSSAGAGARWRGALGQTCGRGGAGRRAGTGLQGAPRMRGCPSIPASLPPARCAGRGQGSRSDGRGCGRLALTPPRIPGTHGLPLVSRQRTSPPGMRACLLAKATPDERGTPKAERRRSAHSAASTENLQ